jgi:thymidylate synthase
MIKNIFTGEEFSVNPTNKFYFNETDKEYHLLLEKILREGIWKQNRTGIKTISIFGPQIIFKNVGEKFPLLTTKKIFTKGLIGELLWFLSGSTDKKVLQEKYDTSIWNEWNSPNPKFDGDMGPIYGYQWVKWKYYDEKTKEFKFINQIQEVINTLKNNPDDRRMIVSAWAPHDIPDMALPPCHWSYQFYSVLYPGDTKRTLHIIENQRSIDTFLGLSWNIASYAILLMMVAQQVDMKPGNLIMNLGDTHLYENHLEFVFKQLERTSTGVEPQLIIQKQKDIFSYEPEHFKIENYNALPNWKNVPIAV